MSLSPHLYSDDEDVEGVRLLGCGQRLPLALQLGHLHPLAIVERVLTVQVTDGDQQHVAVAVLDGLVVDATQIVSSQQALQRRGRGCHYLFAVFEKQRRPCAGF